MREGYFFRTSLFEVEPGEDEETNPRCYGKQLAVWLKGELESRGYPVESVIAEDWGWCVMCHREPFRLWVGCSNRRDYETVKQGDPPPKKENVLWHCFPHTEVPVLKRLFGKVNTEAALNKLEADLKQILSGEKQITLVSGAET